MAICSVSQADHPSFLEETRQPLCSLGSKAEVLLFGAVATLFATPRQRSEPHHWVPRCARRANPARARSPRRGAIYIVVLLTALIIACISLAALQLSRVQNAAGTDGNSFVEARTIARAAIDIGMLKIRNDPYWRTNLGNGTWVNNQT